LERGDEFIQQFTATARNGALAKFISIFFVCGIGKLCLAARKADPRRSGCAFVAEERRAQTKW
jgi:hypothetical protein